MNPRVKIIVSSGLPANTSAVKTASLRGKTLIAKPYTAEKLLTTLHELLHRH